MPVVSLIAAVAGNGGIGCNNQLIWRNREDMQRLKRLTLGHPVVMGRKTWDSIGRPLPGRRNLVVSRNAGWQADGAERMASLPAAMAACGDFERVYVLGGAQVYADALPLADELVLTEIDAVFEADAFFPAWDRSQFTRVDSTPGTTAPGEPAFTFNTYRRRTTP